MKNEPLKKWKRKKVELNLLNGFQFLRHISQNVRILCRKEKVPINISFNHPNECSVFFLLFKSFFSVGLSFKTSFEKKNASIFSLRKFSGKRKCGIFNTNSSFATHSLRKWKRQVAWKEKKTKTLANHVAESWSLTWRNFINSSYGIFRWKLFLFLFSFHSFGLAFAHGNETNNNNAQMM